VIEAGTDDEEDEIALLDELDAANNGLENTRAKIVSLNALGMLKTNDIIHFYDDQQTNDRFIISTKVRCNAIKLPMSTNPNEGGKV
jgi:hypothetical protein